MKQIVLLIFLFSSILLSGQQIVQLDSIVYEDLDTGEFFPLTYTYDEDDKLVFIGGLDEGTIDLEITYNENGDYDTWTAMQQDPETTLVLTFGYDDQNNLISAVSNFENAGYAISLIYTIETENGLIKRVKYDEDYGGYVFTNSDRIFTYDTEGRLDSILSLDIFYNTGNPEEISDFEYIDDKLFTVTHSNLLYPSEGYKDSIGFDTDNSTLTHEIVFNDPDSESSFITTYMESTPFIDEEFIGPLDFYYLSFLLFDDEYPEVFYTLINNDRPVSHVTNTNFSLFRGTWFYTITVNNQVKDIVAQPFAVQPNPSSDFIEILLEEDISTVDIYTMSGELVQSVSSQNKTIDIQNLKKGSYLVLLKTINNDNYFSKVVKL